MIPGLMLVFTLHLGAHDAPAESGDRWLASDKAKHFLTSAFVETFSFSALRVARVSKEGALVAASVATAGVGIGKELYDRKFGGDPSLKDLTVDGVGIGAAVVLLRHTAR